MTAGRVNYIFCSLTLGLICLGILVVRNYQTKPEMIYQVPSELLVVKLNDYLATTERIVIISISFFIAVAIHFTKNSLFQKSLTALCLLGWLCFIISCIEKNTASRRNASATDTYYAHVAIDPTFFPVLYLAVATCILLLSRSRSIIFDTKLALIDLFLITTMTAMIFATQPIVTRIFGLASH